MKHLNSETLKNILDTMQRGRSTTRIGERHKESGLPVVRTRRNVSKGKLAWLLRFANGRSHGALKVHEKVIGRGK